MHGQRNGRLTIPHAKASSNLRSDGGEGEVFRWGRNSPHVLFPPSSQLTHTFALLMKVSIDLHPGTIPPTAVCIVRPSLSTFSYLSNHQWSKRTCPFLDSRLSTHHSDRAPRNAPLGSYELIKARLPVCPSRRTIFVMISGSPKGDGRRSWFKRRTSKKGAIHPFVWVFSMSSEKDQGWITILQLAVFDCRTGTWSCGIVDWCSTGGQRRYNE